MPHFVYSDDARKTTFDEREMNLLRAMLLGDCSMSRFSEGGDYAYLCWGATMKLSRVEVDAFLRKLEGA